jgi:hypothetical protein
MHSSPLHVVGKVVTGNDKILQGFPDKVDPSFHLTVEHCFLLVVTIAIVIASQ